VDVSPTAEITTTMHDACWVQAARTPLSQTSRRGTGLGPINGTPGRRGAGTYTPGPRPPPAVWWPGFRGCCEKCSARSTCGGQVGRIPGVSTTQGDGWNPQVPPGKPRGAHSNSPGKQLQPVAERRAPRIRGLERNGQVFVVGLFRERGEGVISLMRKHTSALQPQHHQTPPTEVLCTHQYTKGSYLKAILYMIS
jgi:hypothetical protein